MKKILNSLIKWETSNLIELSSPIVHLFGKAEKGRINITSKRLEGTEISSFNPNMAAILYSWFTVNLVKIKNGRCIVPLEVIKREAIFLHLKQRISYKNFHLESGEI